MAKPIPLSMPRLCGVLQMQPEATIHLRAPAALKGAWVAASRSHGMTLGDWIIQRINMSDDANSCTTAAMSPADLRAWQASMGFTNVAAAAALRVTTRTYADWIAGVSRTTGKPINIPGMVGLACAAHAAGLSEWRQAP